MSPGLATACTSRTRFRARLGAGFSVLLATFGAAPRASGEEVARPRLTVGALSGELRLDGALDEPAWAAAPAIENLTMVEPRQGEAPTAKTVVKILADSRALVLAIRCEDPEPAGIVSFTTACRHGSIVTVVWAVATLLP